MRYVVHLTKALADDAPAVRHYIEWHSGGTVVGWEIRHVTVDPMMVAAFPGQPAEDWYAVAEVDGVSA